MNSRNEYQIGADQKGIVRVALIDPEAQTDLPGELLSIDAVGASARFPIAIAPALALNSRVELRFTGQRFRKGVTAPVQVQSRNEEDDARTFGFWFSNPHDVEDSLFPHLETLLNRRSAYRVQPDRNMPILITIETPEGVDLCGPLLSISTSGMAVRTSIEDEGSIARSTDVVLSFSLPGQTDDRIRLPSAIKYRRLAGRHAQFGIEYKQVDSREHEECMDAILRYVHSRQQEILRRRRAG